MFVDSSQINLKASSGLSGSSETALRTARASSFTIALGAHDVAGLAGEVPSSHLL